jgi:pantoate--beta-alanine ligase
MEIVTDIRSLRNRLSRESNVGLVPTMGNLHEGHLSLVRIAQRKANCTVVSIFVNRLQFSPEEDFERYPRTLARDCDFLEKQGVDVVFAPEEKMLYRKRQEFMLAPPPLAHVLEGKFRQGFFAGMATLVLKLFNLVQPDIAVFGKKDYQQLCILRQMVQQLNLPLDIEAGETVRAPDLLALSSRNHYLSAAERVEATRLYHSLLQVKREIGEGSRHFHELSKTAKKNLCSHGWKVDYIAVRRADTLAPAQARDKNIVVLGAAMLGTTRLIDNLEVQTGKVGP